MQSNTTDNEYVDMPQEVYDTIMLYLPRGALASLSLASKCVNRSCTSIASNDYYWLRKLSITLGVEVGPEYIKNTTPSRLYRDIEKLGDKPHTLSTIGAILTGNDVKERLLNLSLVTASREGCVEVMKLLLAGGADPNANGGGPLRQAVVAGKDNAVRLLLDNSRIDLGDVKGSSLVFNAYSRRHTNILRVLVLDHRVDHSRYTKDLRRWAIQGGHTDIQALLEEEAHS